jgi:hypothetical protein
MHDVSQTDESGMSRVCAYLVRECVRGSVYIARRVKNLHGSLVSRVYDSESDIAAVRRQSLMMRARRCRMNQVMPSRRRRSVRHAGDGGRNA